MTCIGIATVYRTMNLVCEAGLAREIELGDGNIRYEHLLGHEHHDHLVCVKCGAFEEIINSKIEKEQKAIAQQFGYLLCLILILKKVLSNINKGLLKQFLRVTKK